MADKENFKCQGCGRDLQGMPVGRHLCHCGVTTMIEPDIPFEEEPPKAKASFAFPHWFPNTIEVFIIIATLGILAQFPLRYFYAEKWRESEINFFSRVLGVDQGTGAVIHFFSLAFLVAAYIVVYLFFKWRGRRSKKTHINRENIPF